MIDIGADLRKAYDEGYADGKRDAASPWHRVEDELPKDGQCCLFFTNESGRPERDAWIDTYRNDWIGDIDMGFDYWMPIEPPKEDA